MGIDPMASAISMISCGEEVITSQGLKVTDIESIQNEQLLNEVFYECKKDILEKEAMETPSLAELLDIKIPIVRTDENNIQENKLLPDAALLKSVSSGCLRSVEWLHGAAVKPSFLDFPGIDFENAYGMRRAFSEGDIKVRSNPLWYSCVYLIIGLYCTFERFSLLLRSSLYVAENIDLYLKRIISWQLTLHKDSLCACGAFLLFLKKCSHKF